MMDEDKFKAIMDIFSSQILTSSFLPKNTIFMMNPDTLKSVQEEFLFKKPFVPQPFEKEPVDKCKVSQLSYGCYAEMIRSKRTLEDRLKCIPYIFKVAFGKGWGPGELRDYWTFENKVTHPMGGVSISTIGA